MASDGELHCQSGLAVLKHATSQDKVLYADGSILLT
jgi:hypothetical protein